MHGMEDPHDTWPGHTDKQFDEIVIQCPKVPFAYHENRGRFGIRRRRHTRIVGIDHRHPQRVSDGIKYETFVQPILGKVLAGRIRELN
jgi:hypothetical protein